MHSAKALIGKQWTINATCTTNVSFCQYMCVCLPLALSHPLSLSQFRNNTHTPIVGICSVTHVLFYPIRQWSNLA